MAPLFYVYFMAGESRALYLAVTGNLAARVLQHKEQLLPAFIQKHKATKLVWFELHATARAALDRETEIKKLRRPKKLALIESLNPHWQDLAPYL